MKYCTRTMKGIASGTLALALYSTAGLAQDKPSFIAEDKLVICVDPTFPPMGFMDESGSGEPVGFDPDLSMALAKHWGVDIKFVRMDFTGLLPSLEAGRCGAVISGATLTAKRQESFDGIPYLDTNYVIAARADAGVFENETDLADKTIAVQAGTTYFDRLQEINSRLEAAGLKPMKIQQYPKQSDAIQQLLVNRADGVATQDTEVAYREMQTPNQFKTVWTIKTDVASPFAIYIRPNKQDKESVTAALVSLANDGTLAEVAEKWKLDPAKVDAARK